jgi:hypothetical protein
VHRLLIVDCGSPIIEKHVRLSSAGGGFILARRWHPRLHLRLDDKSAVFPACASAPGNFFMLTQPSQIATAFAQIGTSIAKLRVAR